MCVAWRWGGCSWLLAPAESLSIFFEQAAKPRPARACRVCVEDKIEDKINSFINGERQVRSMPRPS